MVYAGRAATQGRPYVTSIFFTIPQLFGVLNLTSVQGVRHPGHLEACAPRDGNSAFSAVVRKNVASRIGGVNGRVDAKGVIQAHVSRSMGTLRFFLTSCVSAVRLSLVAAELLCVHLYYYY